jgi:lipid A 3-O-deacylase
MNRDARRILVAIGMAAMTMVSTLSAHAQSLPERRPLWMPDKVFAQIGTAADARMAAVGAAWEVPALRGFVEGNSSGYVEASIGRWVADVNDGARSSAWVTQAGITPVLRWHPFDNARWFTEAGIGVNVLAPLYRSRDKRFSTAFNFGDHVGIGMQLGEDHQQELSLRLQHFSNAGIKDPNPGENFLQLRYTARL